MDPNKALTDISDALAQIEFQEDIGAENYSNDTVIALTASVDALLAWLAKGGFAPDWKKYNA